MKYLSLVFGCLALVASEEVEDRLTKIWSVSGSAPTSGRTTIVDTVNDVVIKPGSYGRRQARLTEEFHPYNLARRFAFKPRATPKERSVHFSEDKPKSEILFPGNYFPIADEKKDNLTEFNPLGGGPFQPTAIPLLRTEERSMNDEVVKGVEGFARRSLSTLFDEDEDDDDDEFEEEDENGVRHAKHKGGHGAAHAAGKIRKRYAKYMLPLLLAYKMKFFSMIPLMIGGLVLLVGATGMAGFFFALFAAVMGLQKGSY